MRNLKFYPYKSCIGRKYRSIPKLYRPFVCLINSNLCNMYLLNKNKIKFINQWLRWFYKSRWGYLYVINNKDKSNEFYTIVDGSVISLCARTQKAAFKNLLLKLNYGIDDYKALKKRQYILHFTVLFLNIENELNDNVDVDILSFHEDLFRIFIILNGNYVVDFYNILYYYDNILNNIYYSRNQLGHINVDDFNVFFNNLNLDECELTSNNNG